LKFVKETFNKCIPVGAICGAVDYLAKHGFLNDSRHTGNTVYLWEDYNEYNSKDNFIEEQAVKDGKLVTANGTAPIEFTELVLELIEFASPNNIENLLFKLFILLNKRPLKFSFTPEFLGSIFYFLVSTFTKFSLFNSFIRSSCFSFVKLFITSVVDSSLMRRLPSSV